MTTLGTIHCVLQINAYSKQAKSRYTFNSKYLKVCSMDYEINNGGYHLLLSLSSYFPANWDYLRESGGVPILVATSARLANL